MAGSSRDSEALGAAVGVTLAGQAAAAATAAAAVVTAAAAVVVAQEAAAAHTEEVVEVVPTGVVAAAAPGALGVAVVAAVAGKGMIIPTNKLHICWA